MSRDTSPAEVERYHEMLRRLDPSMRLRAAVSLSSTVRALAVAGLRARHPLADDREVRVRLTALLYGRSVAALLFGAVPEDAPSCSPTR